MGQEKKILINATDDDEFRVAMLLDGNRLHDYYHERRESRRHVGKQGNVLKGRIMQLVESLEAAFVAYGADRHGFLPFREISPEYYTKRPIDGEATPNIQDVLREGQEVMVQVMKEERGTKGAALTTYITLAGCYLVLMPNNPNAGGVSRRIDAEERSELREILNNLQVPEGMSAIIRTAGVEKTQEELKWDLDLLIQQWEAICRAYQQRPAPVLIHQESDVIIRTIRDHLRRDVSAVIVDNPKVYAEVEAYVRVVRPEFVNLLKLYQDDDVPLFTRYQIEKQIKTVFDRELTLPSGASIVFGMTEALTSVDINSAKATKGSDIEETAFKTNLEAADEIARQLRLRDLGGLIVIDFIDMEQSSHQREVENRLREALKFDRARVQVGRISRFGLLEMSRQRLHPTVGEAHQIICPQCHGQGTVQNVEAMGLTLIRLIEEEAIRQKAKHIHVQLPLETATFLLNEKRTVISNLERRYSLQISLIPNLNLKVPQYKFSFDFLLPEELEKKVPSYAEIQARQEIEPTFVTKSPATTTPSSPAVKTIVPEKPREEPSFIRRLWAALFGTTSAAPVEKTQPVRQDRHRGRHRNRRNYDNRRREHHTQPVVKSATSHQTSHTSPPTSGEEFKAEIRGESAGRRHRRGMRRRGGSRGDHEPRQKSHQSTESAQNTNVPAEVDKS